MAIISQYNVSVVIPMQWYNIFSMAIMCMQCVFKYYSMQWNTILIYLQCNIL